jgi:hypothetical protein
MLSDGINTLSISPQEPEQLKEEEMLPMAEVGSGGQNVYSEKCEARQKPNDTSEVNVNVETVTRQDSSVLKICNAVQEFASLENFAQNVSPDMKDEKLSSPVPGSLPTNHTEDVFLPITTNQVK